MMTEKQIIENAKDLGLSIKDYLKNHTCQECDKELTDGEETYCMDCFDYKVDWEDY